MSRIEIHLAYLFIFLLLAITPACTTRPPQSFEEVDTGSMVLPSESEFEVAEYSTVAVEKSLAKVIVRGDFRDSSGDGIADTVIWGEMDISGDVKREDVRGYAYNDGRYVVFYPSGLTGLPPPGEVRLLGFFHYFDGYFLDAALAVVIKQKSDDASRKGTVALFLGDNGLRTANPAYGFLPRGDVESLDSYHRWPDSGLDFAIAADPKVDQFFILLKDFGLPDELFFVAFKWY